MRITRSWRSLTALAAGLALTVSLAACAGGSGNASDDTPADTQGDSRTADQGASDGAARSDGGTLVVYYSATGNTERVARIIADATDGDLFALEPSDPYTDDDLDWTDGSSRVSAEHEDESLRDVDLVADTVDGWDQYDTVFIGYPIWWGIAAWPVDGFVEANDFTGKTVVPFCTSASSGIGGSGDQLAELAGTGDWLEGERFSSGADEADVQAWIDGLGL